MKRETTILACLAVWIAVAAGGAGAAESAPAIDFVKAEPGFALLGSLPEPLDRPALERAAFLASGIEPDGLGGYEARLDRIVGDVDAQAGGDPEAVLRILHQTILRAYREDATTLDGILDLGLYNCVSSAVLYMLAVRDLGIEVRGVRTSDHAFCSVIVGGRSLDVETTNPYGFDPGGKKEFKDSFGKVTGFAYVAPGGYGDRKSIGGRELVGLILSNRVAALERGGRFAEAAKLGVDYAALCPGSDSRSFLVDRINNYITDLESRRDFAGAESAALAAAAELPGEPKLAALARTASYNKAVALGQSGDWKAAFDAAALAASASPGDGATAALVSGSLASLAQAYARKGDFAGARAAIAERAGRAGPTATAAALSLVGDSELVGAANGLPFAEAVAAADRILSAGEVAPARYAQAVAAIFGNEAGRIGSGGDWLAAAAIAERGIAKLAQAKAPGDGGLARLAQNLRRNFVAETHNRFARAYNSRDYAGAKATITAALASMPGDETLKGDLATVEAALSN